MNKPVDLLYFSDVLCVWSYVSQIRLDELRNKFGEQVRVEHRFISVFGDTETRIGKGWQERGGYEAFADKMLQVVKIFPHITINPQIWRTCRPRSCMTGHLFIKSAQLLEQLNTGAENTHEDSGRPLLEELIWQIRCAFFVDARDVGDLSVLSEIAKGLGFPVSEIKSRINDGSAMAALARDLELKENYNIEGSPTYVLNEGRQKLFGNVGYRVIEANVAELIQHPEDQASWC